MEVIEMETNVNISIGNFNTISAKYTLTSENEIQTKERADYVPPMSTGITIYCINFND